MRTYLGDAVYVELDGAALVLTTSNGERDTNRIVLDVSVLSGLVAFLRRLDEDRDVVQSPKSVSRIRPRREPH